LLIVDLMTKNLIKGKYWLNYRSILNVEAVKLVFMADQY